MARNLFLAVTACCALGGGMAVGIAAESAGAAPPPFHAPVTLGTIPMTGSIGGIAVDRAGNVFATDTAGNKVYELARGSSTVMPVSITVAGTTPDLSAPRGLAVDEDGDLFIADSGNDRIVKLPAGSSTGSRLLFGGTAAYSVAVSADGAEVWSTSYDGINRLAVQTSTSAHTDVLASATPAISTVGLAMDPSGNVFVADSGSGDRIIEVPAGSRGAPVTYLSGPFTTDDSFFGGLRPAVAADGAGNLFVVTGTRNLLEVPAGGGPAVQIATTAVSVGANDIAADVAGNVYTLQPGAGTVTVYPAVLPTGSIRTDVAHGTPGSTITASSSSACPSVYTTGVTVSLENSSGSVVASATAQHLDSSGNWAGTITVPANAPSGSYFVSAQCTSQGLALQNSNVASFTVDQAPPAATQLVAASEKRANPTHFSATLTSGGSPVAGAQITFTTKKSGTGTVVQCTATTSNTGVASCTGQNAFALSAKKVYLATFSGNSSYLASTGTGALHS